MGTYGNVWTSMDITRDTHERRETQQRPETAQQQTRNFTKKTKKKRKRSWRSFTSFSFLKKYNIDGGRA